jgi:O-6-methylguanine DNA methyltransferase
MRTAIKYNVFKTTWGYFGLAAVDEAIVQTRLPEPDKEAVETKLLTGFDETQKDSGILQQVQEKITAYFEGEFVDFNDGTIVSLDGFSIFQKRILAACRGISLGEVATYSQLAQKARAVGAARAAGTVMAGNPIPLIIPCHRVVRTDGGLGGFSAPGGTELKKRLLAHEQTIIKNIARSGQILQVA